MDTSRVDPVRVFARFGFSMLVGLLTAAALAQTQDPWARWLAPAVLGDPPTQGLTLCFRPGQGWGGLDGEMVQNGDFERHVVPPGARVQGDRLVGPRAGSADPWELPWSGDPFAGWRVDLTGASEGVLRLAQESAPQEASPNVLEMEVGKVDPDGRMALLNEGFGGMALERGKGYRLSFYACSDEEFAGSIDVLLESADRTPLARHTFETIPLEQWKRFECELTPSADEPRARLAFSFGAKGIVWLDLVSLRPAATFGDRPRGVPQAVVEAIRARRPGFLRWPEGEDAAGLSLAAAFDWKRTLGPPEARRPGFSAAAGAWNRHGFGYGEFLQLCEDLGVEAMLVVNGGFASARFGGDAAPPDRSDAVVDDALQAIEFAVGSPETPWGKRRAESGHPAPYPLRYVQLGAGEPDGGYVARLEKLRAAAATRFPSVRILAADAVREGR